VQIEPSSALVTDAQRLLAASDIEGAHSKVNQLPEGDNLRNSPEVKAVEAAWADSVFTRVGQEADLAKRKALLGRVSNASMVDPERRRKASDMLHDVDTAGSATGEPSPGSTAPSPVPSSTGTGDALPAKTGKDAPKAAPTTGAADKPKDKDSSTATSSGGADPMKTALDGNDGPAKARKMLEPKVWSGRASPEEIKMLIAICRQMHDAACVSRARLLLQDKK